MAFLSWSISKYGDLASVWIQLPFRTTSALFFKDRFYCTDMQGSIWEINPDQKTVNRVFCQNIFTRCWHLVESGRGMLLIELYPILEGMCLIMLLENSMFSRSTWELILSFWPMILEITQFLSERGNELIRQDLHLL